MAGHVHNTICKGGCKKCHGSKLIANDEEGTPWCHWAELPPGSDVAVRMGIVRPVPCHECADVKREDRKGCPKCAWTGWEPSVYSGRVRCGFCAHPAPVKSWRVGDVVGAEEYAFLPVGTEVAMFPESSGWVVTAEGMHSKQFGVVVPFGSVTMPRVIRSLPAGYAPREDLPATTARAWKVGDVVEGKEAFDSLPAGATVWKETDESGFWSKASADQWVDEAGYHPMWMGSPRTIRSLPAHYAQRKDPACAKCGGGGLQTSVHNGLEPCASCQVAHAAPAPAERKPCAAWDKLGAGVWRLGSVEGNKNPFALVTWWHSGGGQITIRGAHYSEAKQTLEASLLAAEDALLADARKVFKTILGVDL